MFFKCIANLACCNTQHAGGLGLNPAGFLHHLNQLFARHPGLELQNNRIKFR